MRDRASHTAHCSSLTGPLREHYSTNFGINHDSILNTSRYFHVTEGLVPDAVHDLLEGILPLEMKQLIKVFIEKKYVTLQQLNERIQGFPYTGPDSRNKPALIALTTLNYTS
jgi:hypothetical protein